MFRVPDSSDPPSTPDSRRSSNMFQNPSTTPAGPPPTGRTSASFTPAGPPPSSVFGSSQMNTGSAFPSAKPLGGGLRFGGSQQGPTVFSGFGTQERSSRLGFQVPNSTPPRMPGEGDEDAEGKDDDMEEGGYEDEDADGDYDDDDGMDEGDPDATRYDFPNAKPVDAGGHRFGGGAAPLFNPSGSFQPSGSLFESTNKASLFPSKPLSTANPFQSSAFVPDPEPTSRSTKWSRLDDQSMLEDSMDVEQSQEARDMASIAKGLAAASSAPTLRESDEFIIQNEQLVNHLKVPGAIGTVTESEEQLAIIAEKLLGLWRDQAKALSSEDLPPNIQFVSSEDPLVQANLIASLLVQLHHPSRINRRSATGVSRFGASSFAIATRSQPASPIPRVLLDWLDAYHSPMIDEYESLIGLRNDYTDEDCFWDVVINCLLRGRFTDAIRFLRGANWRTCPPPDGYNPNLSHYSDRHALNIEKACSSLVQLLETSPAVQYNNWDVKGSDWRLFRHKAQQAMEALDDFAQGDRIEDARASMFQADNFGMSSRSVNFGISTASQKIENGLPNDIVETLEVCYGILIGDVEEIMANAADWVEAAISLTVWWDGNDIEIPKGSLRSSLRRSRISIAKQQERREVDTVTLAAYRGRLARAFKMLADQAKENDTFRVERSNPVEVGVSCVISGDVDSVITILRPWSLTITSALAELAGAGGWLSVGPKSKALMNGFDKSDLMVLSMGQQEEKGSTKDDILTEYADLIFERPTLKSSDHKIKREGWELAIAILGRLDSTGSAKSKIGGILDRLKLDSSTRVDKALALCNDLGFADHADALADRYASSLAGDTYNYGDALYYFARAHNVPKLKMVLEILVAHCLVNSMPYPPLSDVDDRLRAFITAPRQTLTDLSRTDMEAAQLLSTYLSGYATVRKFYDIRDEEAILPAGRKPHLRPLARKREAAKALMAVIISAADSIRGGLFDPDVDVVISVDGLLTLFGEALPFLNHPTPILTQKDVFTLLRTLEDLCTSPSRVREAAENCLNATLAAHHPSSPSESFTSDKENAPPSPRTTLKRSLAKSTSNLTTASSFEMVGSQMFRSVASTASGRTGFGSGESSAVILKPRDGGEKVKKGWDWRDGVKRGTGADELVAYLRIRLAQSVAKGWTGEWML